MIKTNRRFPFERTKEPISLENFTTTEQQLYPIIRQYASVNRLHGHEEPRQPSTNVLVLHQENDRLNQLMTHLKQPQQNHFIDPNDFSALRQDHLQHWKHVKYQWQEYYRDEIRRQQEIFNNVIKSSM
jgi:hypothetical protein